MILKILQNSKIEIDILITDVIMPGIGGYQLINIISQIKTHQPSILIISGQKEIQNKKYKFLAKPFNTKELILKIKEIEKNLLIKNKKQ